MRKIGVATCAALGVTGLVFIAEAQSPNGAPAGRGTGEAYRVPRTPWGDPDLEGTWPGTQMAGVPLQRPESFGTRNVLTDAEFAERRAQAARQAVQDLADFDFERPGIRWGQVGGGQSPPQHWFERGETQRQVSLIHESRVVPLDGRPHLGKALRSYMGDSRGRWDGDTLVVETTNFADRPGVGMNGTGASDALTITERFARTSATTIRYSVTVDDPMTWTAPFTMQYELARDERYGMFEYACHEGNYALQNIMSGERATERRR
jgi:hypothetical protein